MTDTYNFSSVHGFEQEALKAIIGGVNATLGAEPFRLVGLDITSELITATDLNAAYKLINKWIKPLSPSQGWSQHFSDKHIFSGGREEYETPPLHAELLCEDKISALIKHVGGFDWRLVTITESESGSNMVAAQDFSLLCSESGIKRLNYTQYWDGKDGALIPFMERFTGFTTAEEN